ncbi:MAG: hypothetical protein FD126_2314, partial [Elusimicrobia bacterium]
EQTLVQTAQQAFMKVLDKLLEGKKDGGGSPGGGSPGGGSPGGGKPEDPKGQLGNGAATPAGNQGNGTTIAKGDKAVPAAKAATGAEKSVTGQASVHEASRAKVDSVMARFEAGTNGEVTGIVNRIKPAVQKGSELKLGDMAKPVEEANARVEEFKKAIDAEKTRMDGEVSLAAAGKEKLGGHTAKPNSLEPTQYDLEGGKSLTERSGQAPKGPTAPQPFDPAAGVKAAEDALKAAEANKKLVADAQAALTELNAFDKMPPEAKATLTKLISPQIANMDAALNDIISGSKSYIENMKAVKEHTEAAGKQLEALVKENDKLQEKVTEAYKKGAELSKEWHGTRPEEYLTKKKTAETAFETAGKEAKRGGSAAEKIKKTVIE